MKTVVVGALVVAVLVPVPASAKADNTGVARQRMTAQLFAEYNSEESVGFEYDGYRRRYERQLMMKEGPDATGSTWWVPVELKISCHGRSCIGRVWTEEFPQQYVLEDHATFRGRKGTYRESGWNPPS
ncbi:MAG: hypothetical protein ACYDHN_01625 [Solirubrobacteraceae bacterium]